MGYDKIPFSVFCHVSGPVADVRSTSDKLPYSPVEPCDRVVGHLAATYTILNSTYDDGAHLPMDFYSCALISCALTDR